MLARKGITIQFNWIFILIAGALILVFFFMLVQGQRNSAMEKLQIDISGKMDTILTTASKSTGTQYRILSPDLEVTLDCTGLTVGRIRRDTALLTQFSPTKMHSKRGFYSLMVLPWEVPFKVTNFLYMTSPDVRYIVLDRTALADAVGEYFFRDSQITLADNITKEFHMASCSSLESSMADHGHDKVRFVFFGDPETDFEQCAGIFSGMRNKDVTAVVFRGIEYISDLYSYGPVQYYEKSGSSNPSFVEAGETYYLGLPSLIGAIYAEDKESYECSMKEAFRKLNVIADVHVSRAHSLRDEFTNELPNDERGCSVYYDEVISSLQGIAGKADSLATAGSFDDGGVEALVEGVANDVVAVQHNNILLELYSCPYIY